MSRICQITGAKVSFGHRNHRSGKAKKEGGIGRHLTKRVKRRFYPNILDKNVWVPELNKFVKVRITARALKTINKNGAFRTLVKAGLVNAPRRKKKAVAAAA
jgi:large subunit ribosomal protein L28